MTLTTTHRAPGFRVTKTDHHTVFHDVPIFAECERGEFVADAAWIAAAVAEAKQGERDGHLPPLHAQHHDPQHPELDATVRSVGVFRVLGSGPLTFKGRRVTAVFADLIVTDDDFAAELERMRYPYRSVEIFRPDGPPKINGLALLDHEAPYLELPMLFAGEIDDKRSTNLTEDHAGPPGVASATFALNYSHKAGDPMVGSATNGERLALMFQFQETTDMAPSTDETKTIDETKVDETVVENFADDEKDGDDENMEDGGMDVSGIVKAIESGSISVSDMDAILAAIQNQKTESAPEEDTEEPAPAPTPGAEIMSSSIKGAALNFAQLKGENEALKARLDARDAADKRAADVRDALKRLEGLPLGADLEERLVKFHDTVQGNPVAFKEYVETMARSTAAFDDDNTAAENFKAHPKTPKEALRFQAVSAEAVELASTYAREYDQFPGRIRAGKDAYVAVNMQRRHGIELPSGDQN